MQTHYNGNLEIIKHCNCPHSFITVAAPHAKLLRADLQHNEMHLLDLALIYVVRTCRNSNCTTEFIKDYVKKSGLTFPIE